LITGASGALGGEMARYMIKQGYNVILNYHDHPGKIDKLLKEINNGGGEHTAIKCDITVEEEVIDMFRQISEKYGKLDCLVNNVGIHIDSPTWKLSLEDWQKVVDVNLTGTFLCSKHAIPLMKENGYGRIISISSVVGQRGEFGTSNYAASKSGLFGLTKTIAREVAKYDITCNTVVLGYFSIGMINDVPMEMQERIKKTIPLKRFGDPKELNALVSYLFSEDASYMTGQILGLNGGYYM